MLHRPSPQEEMQKEVLPGYPWPICTRWTIPQEYDWNWSNRRSFSPNGWSCGRRSKKLRITKVIGGFVRTRYVPILCQSGTNLTSNKHCQPCGNWRKKKKKKFNETNDGHKVILLLGGAGKDHGGLLMPTKVTVETYPVLIDQGNLINK